MVVKYCHFRFLKLIVQEVNRKLKKRVVLLKDLYILVLQPFLALKMLSAAQMLDELMGRDRNLAPTEKRRETHWEDAEVSAIFVFKSHCILYFGLIMALFDIILNRLVLKCG